MTITLIPGYNPGLFTGAGNNTYLISGREPTLVDAATGDSRHVAAVRQALGTATLTRIVVTHGHADHVAGTVTLAAEWPEAEMVKMPWPGRDDAYPVGWRPLEDGDVVTAGDGELRAIHTPGHAPDHVCFFNEAEDLLFCGDLLVRGSTVVIPGSAEGSVADYLASLARIRELRPARVLPAHGPEIDDVVGLIDHYVEHRQRRDGQVIAALGAGLRTRDAMVDQMYAGLSDKLKRVAAESVLAHLLKLKDEGRVREADGEWELV